MDVSIVRLPHAPRELPSYASDGAAGMDLALAGEEVSLQPGERALLPTGFCFSIPSGYEGQVRLRSGFARRTGCLMPNAPGTIDSDYRGELLVLLMNATDSPVTVASGERFAQLVICPVARATLIESRVLLETTRGEGGFGSTGR